MRMNFSKVQNFSKVLNLEKYWDFGKGLNFRKGWDSGKNLNSDFKFQINDIESAMLIMICMVQSQYAMDKINVLVLGSSF